MNAGRGYFSPEDEFLLLCARQAFDTPHRMAAERVAHTHSLDWATIFRTSRLHGITPLVFHNLQKCHPAVLNIPPVVDAEFRKSTFRNISRHAGMMARLGKGVAFLQERSLEVMLIKGGALAVLVYQNPWFTIPHDLDIVLSTRADALSAAERNALTVFFHNSQIEFDFWEHHDVTMNGALPIDFARIWDDSRKITLDGYTVRVMSNEDVLLAALINSCRKRYFRLKSLVDIAEAAASLPIDWAVFLRNVHAVASEKIAFAALTVTAQTVGLSLPTQVWAGLGLSAVEAGVMRRTIQAILRHKPLAQLYPFTGRTIFGRQMSLPLVLTYLSYRRGQMGHKLREVATHWRGGRQATTGGE